MVKGKPPVKLRKDKKSFYYNPMFREARVIEKGYTMSKLAELVGINTGEISHIEHLCNYPNKELGQRFEETLENLLIIYFLNLFYF